MLQIGLSIFVWFIAIIGLFGETSHNNRLNKKGLSVLVLLTLSVLLSGYISYNEETIKTNNALVKNDARKTVLYRLRASIEDIKSASLWKKRDYFSLNLPIVDVNKYVLKISSPNDGELAHSERLIRKPFKRAVNNLRTINNRYSDYMSFKERDYVSLILDTVDNHNILPYLASIQGTNINEYKKRNDLYLEQYGGYKYFFTALSALDQEVQSSIKKELKDYFKLRPECENPIDSSMIIECI